MDRHGVLSVAVRALAGIPRPLLSIGRPIVVDGQELDRRVQLALRLARLVERPRTLDVDAARARVVRQARAFRGRPIPVARVEPLSIPPGIRARHYVPAGAGPALLLYFHGGGFVAGDLGGPVAVGGDSAGANLAAGVSLLADAKPTFQLLFYPWLDLSAKRASYRLFGDGFFLTEQQLDWYRDQYLATPDDALDPRCSPLLDAAGALRMALA